MDTNLDCNAAVERFYDFVEESLKDNIRKCGRNTMQSFPRNEWFDNECKKHKQALRHAVNKAKMCAEVDKFVGCIQALYKKGKTEIPETYRTRGRRNV